MYRKSGTSAFLEDGITLTYSKFHREYVILVSEKS